MANGFDENTMNNIKNMVDSGNLSDAISQISPEMIENFSKMMNNNSNNNTTKNNNYNTYNENTNDNNNNSNGKTNPNFDLNNIDMNTIMKMKSVIDTMNPKLILVIPKIIMLFLYKKGT